MIGNKYMNRLICRQCDEPMMQAMDNGTLYHICPTCGNCVSMQPLMELLLKSSSKIMSDTDRRVFSLAQIEF